jgi:hypothetical protein
MAYIKKVWRTGDVIEVEKNHTGRYGAPGQKRGGRTKPTREQIRRQNERNAEKKLRRLINSNFREDDLHLILTYKREERPSPQLARDKLKKFLEKLRNRYKKYGKELKYIVTTEWEGKAIHHHLILNDLVTGKITTNKMVRELWEWGRPMFSLLDDTGDYKDLAEYIIKETAKRFREEENPNKQRYSCSRNLIRPQPEVEIVKASTFCKDPKPMRGYYIVKDSLVTGVNPYTGFLYQFYTMRKIGRGKRYGARSENIPGSGTKKP